MFTRQNIIDGLQECGCLSADVIVYPARDVSIDVIMYNGDEALFKKWVLVNVPLGIYVHIEKRDTPNVQEGIRLTHDYTVELCKHRYEES